MSAQNPGGLRTERDIDARLAAIRTTLRDGRTPFEPDAAFAARVVARLPEPPDVLGWAALRLVPAALLLALLCGLALLDLGRTPVGAWPSLASSDTPADLIWAVTFAAAEK